MKAKTMDDSDDDFQPIVTKGHKTLKAKVHNPFVLRKVPCRLH